MTGSLQAGSGNGSSELGADETQSVYAMDYPGTIPDDVHEIFLI